MNAALQRLGVLIVLSWLSACAIDGQRSDVSSRRHSPTQYWDRLGGGPPAGYSNYERSLESASVEPDRSIVSVIPKREALGAIAHEESINPWNDRCTLTEGGFSAGGSLVPFSELRISIVRMSERIDSSRARYTVVFVSSDVQDFYCTALVRPTSGTRKEDVVRVVEALLAMGVQY